MIKEPIYKAIKLFLAICLTVTMLPITAFGADNLYEKTVILYSANIRGDISVYPYMAALKNSYKDKGIDVIMVDVGNYLQGTVYATYLSGKTVVELMDKAGYDVVAIGSHEFDFGTGKVGVEQHEVYYEDDTLGKLLENASFSAVTANILAESASINAFSPTAVIDKSGLKIGFFGLTDPNTVNQVLESNISGLRFTDSVGAAKKQVEALSDCGVIIGLSNVGLTIDIPGAVMIDAASTTGMKVGELVIDNNTGGVVSNTLLDYTSAGQDETVKLAVDTVKEAVDAEFPPGSVLKSRVTLNGSNADSRSKETNTGNLWTDALLWFAVEGGIENYYDEDEIAAGNTGIKVSEDHIVAIWNGGNLRDYLNTGDVTMKDLQRVLPYPNKVAVVYLTGAQILELLESASQGLPYTIEADPTCASFAHVAGIEYTIKVNEPYDAGEAYGKNWFKANSINRVSISNVNGKAFDAAATYAVITSNAIANGMDSNYICLEKDADLSTITSAGVTDVVWMYLNKKLDGVIGEQYASPQGRIVIENSFSDVLPSDWYYESVKHVTSRGLMNGVGNAFNPESKMTGAMLAEALHKLAGSPEATNRFMGINADASEVTRLQLAEYIYLYYGEPAVSGNLAFTDLKEIDGHAADAVMYCYSNGLIAGISDTLFAPNGAVSRAMGAAVLQRMDTKN